MSYKVIRQDAISNETYLVYDSLSVDEALSEYHKEWAKNIIMRNVNIIFQDPYGNRYTGSVDQIKEKLKI